MAEVKVDIRTVLDKKGLTKLKQESKSVLKEVSKTLKADFSKRFVITAGDVVGAVRGLKNLALGAVDTVKELAILNSEMQETDRNFIAFSGGQEQAVQNMAALQRGLAGTTNMMQTQAIGTRFLALGLAESSEELEQFAEIARRLGKIKGLDATKAVESFSLLLSNTSVRRLDTFNISSDQVISRMKELQDATSGMTRNAAFLQATLEIGTQKLKLIGDEVFTTEERILRLDSSVANLKTRFVTLGADADTLGFFDKLIIFGDESVTFIDKLTESAEKLGFGFDTSNESFVAFSKAFLANAPVLIELASIFASTFGIPESVTKAALTSVLLIGDAASKEILAQEAVMQAQNDRTDFAVDSAQDIVDAEIDIADGTEDNVNRIQQIKRDAALRLIQEDKASSERITDIWDTFYDDREGSEADHSKSLANIRKRFAKAASKDDLSLAKDLALLSKNTQKNIQRTQQANRTEDKNERKIRRVDALADERLFIFGLKQLAADGQGAAILEALERRKIEEQIANEKAAVEQEIEKDSRNTEIQTIRETSSERRTQLQQVAAEEKVQREAELAEALAEEETGFSERLTNLTQFRDESLVESQLTNAQVLEDLASSLVLQGELQQRELAKFVQVGGIFGVQAGAALAKGMEEGFRTNIGIAELLSGSPQQASQVINNNVPVNVTGIGGDVLGGLIEDGINGALQQFTDQILIPSFQ